MNFLKDSLIALDNGSITNFKFKKDMFFLWFLGRMFSCLFWFHVSTPIYVDLESPPVLLLYVCLYFN